MLQYPENINLPDVQIWNNAAFDNNSSSIKEGSCCSLQKPNLGNGSKSLKLDSITENITPLSCKSPVRSKSPLSVKPLHPNGAIENSSQQKKPLKLLFKQGLLPQPPSQTISKTENDESKIDAEIESIEAEISRLSSKLESLRLEKAALKQKPKSSVVFQKELQKISSLTANSRIRQRGFSLGPSEILGMRSQNTGKPEKTAIQSTLNRRKSCFFKLPEITEEKGLKGKGGKSSSLSPKSRLSKIQSSRQSLTTIGSKKSERIGNVNVSSIQPKKLFQEEAKSVTAKKPIKPGRVIASRYNQTPTQSKEIRKMSLPGINKDIGKGLDNRRATMATNVYDAGFARNQKTASRTKTPLAVRNEALCDKNSEDFPPPSTLKIDDLLPRIRTLRCKNETPRDSGPAKKVIDLVGRTCFGAEEINVESSICQALSFDAEEDE
ncbi:hypothetical protein MKW98_023893 [Papaver atlanticum]|uniref:Uncharacterized protein n=1 Tax=Papaver atlanticum TaxID=357466 RepID=A0AAD4SZN2_9MAGN|nr:hypothetical protein MKW98_023893 [Papaver atlanticum]